MLDKYFPLYITIFLISTLVTLGIERRLIPFLSKKAQQPIYEGGPKWHAKKSGTPVVLATTGHTDDELDMIRMWAKEITQIVDMLKKGRK